MSLFSFLRKNKQESHADDQPFVSPSASGHVQQARTRKRKQSERGDSPLDPVLPEKKRARRRLIGAVALVLAAIIGLPMILDSEPKPLADDIAIQIPSKDKPAQSSAKPTEQDPPPASVPVNAGLDPKEEIIEPAGAGRSDKSGDTRAEQVAGAGAPSAVASQPTDAAKPPVNAKLPSPVPENGKNQEKAPEKQQESTRAQALLDGKADPRQGAEKKAGSFVVQVAAFASKEKVGEVQARLKEAGIKSYTQTVATESGERIRIRVGPFDSREDADKMRTRLSKLGLNGTLVPA